MGASRLTPRRPHTWSSSSIKGLEGLKLTIQARNNYLVKPLKDSEKRRLITE